MTHNKRILALSLLFVILVFGILLRGTGRQLKQPTLVQNLDSVRLKTGEKQKNDLFSGDKSFRDKLSGRIDKIEKNVRGGWKPNLSLNKSAEKTPKESAKQDVTSSQKEKYKILFWDSLPYFLHPNEQISLCEYNNCEVVTQQSEAASSDAILIYGPAHYGSLNINKRRSQVWIFASMESPLNVFNSFTHLNDKINWTWTYRRDSDIRASYGKILTYSNSVLPSEHEKYLAGKNKSIAWFVSNCNSHSERENYLRVLKNVHPDIDVYGNCGTLTCKYENPKCRGLLNTTYMFYLSFENSICRDYVTEKALAKIGSVVIPVVRGGAEYSVYLPPHSYISTYDFKSIAQLSAKLKDLEKNKMEYKKYHEWRRHYYSQEHKDIVNYEDGWCEICRKLNQQKKFRRLYSDFSKWWNGDVDTSGLFCNSSISDVI